MDSANKELSCPALTGKTIVQTSTRSRRVRPVMTTTSFRPRHNESISISVRTTAHPPRIASYTTADQLALSACYSAVAGPI